MPDQDSPEPPQSVEQGRAEKPGLVSLDQIPEIQAVPVADPKAELEEQELGLEARISDKIAAEQLESRKQDRHERKKYAPRIFILICAWLGALVFILLLQGWGEWGCWRPFRLDRAVLLAFIGGTTLNVLGIFIIVARYLFSRGSTGDE